MGFPRQEYWNGLTFPTTRDLYNPGIEPLSLVPPALQADSLITASPGKPTDSRMCSLIPACALIPIKLQHEHLVLSPPSLHLKLSEPN